MYVNIIMKSFKWSSRLSTNTDFIKATVCVRTSRFACFDPQVV